VLLMRYDMDMTGIDRDTDRRTNRETDRQADVVYTATEGK